MAIWQFSSLAIWLRAIKERQKTQGARLKAQGEGKDANKGVKSALASWQFG
jgi:hypothetical protein